MAPTSEQYVLKVTAGPSYADQSPLSPNTESPFTVSTPELDAAITVRVQNYRGLPAHSPKTSPYFSGTHARDLYSLQFSLVPKREGGLSAADLYLGNDFDHPIRDRLPPGFDHALKIVKWFIDPGLEGDVYADEPGLFGPLLSSINTFRFREKGADGAARKGGSGGEKGAEAAKVGGGEGKEQDAEQDPPYTVVEGADEGEPSTARDDSGIPADAAARKKHFLTPANRDKFHLEQARRYEFDFFNPYLDFNEFALKLPGFSVIPGITIPVISYWDGQPLRYVLRDNKKGEPLFVVIFTLVPKEDTEKEGAKVEEQQQQQQQQQQQKGQSEKTGSAAAVASSAPATTEDDVD